MFGRFFGIVYERVKVNITLESWQHKKREKTGVHLICFFSLRSVGTGTHCTKIKFSVKNFFSKCEQIRIFLQISSHLLKKSMKENFSFCAVTMMASEINSITQNEVTLHLTGHNLNKSPIKILQNSVNLFTFKSYVDFHWDKT